MNLEVDHAILLNFRERQVSNVSQLFHGFTDNVVLCADSGVQVEAITKTL